jgi:hypothetical protein
MPVGFASPEAEAVDIMRRLCVPSITVISSCVPSGSQTGRVSCFYGLVLAGAAPFVWAIPIQEELGNVRHSTALSQSAAAASDGA